MISGCSGDGGLSTAPPNGVMEIPSSASTRIRVSCTSPTVPPAGRGN